MDTQRWQLIHEILADALETPADERAALVRERCGEDAELRGEVESLMAAAQAAEGFLESGAGGAGAGDPGGDTAEVQVGEVISHYRVDGSIGRGGMGEVYRATDVRLGRHVALKLLPSRLAADAAHVSRFKREARLLASINHPNIAAIYDVEETGARKVLVLELVEGPTLADRIDATRGAGLDVDTCVRWARQIAGAVEAAHDVGIVHRDLKPANVKIGAGDRIKVLDFGIAKPELAQLADEPVASATAHSPLITQAGQVIGTVSYMSPEQLRGERVDRRSDVWAFGCLLYEMLAGTRAFAAADASATQELILKDEPDWSRLPDALPVAVRQPLERTLCKDPRQRLQAIGEARIVLDRVLAGEAGDVAPPPPAVRGVPWWAAAALAAAAALLAWLASPTTAPPGSQLQRLQLLAHPEPATPVLSPDGSTIAYVHDDRLWIYALDSLVPRELAAERAFNPAFSPAGDEIAYVASGRLYRVALNGGAPVFVADAPAGTTRVSWGQPDRLILGGTGGLYEADVAGGVPRLVMPLEQGEGVPLDVHATPGGAVLFVDASLDRIDAWVNGRRETVIDAPGARFRKPHWIHGGYLVYTRQGSSPGIWALKLTEQMAPAGTTELVDSAPRVISVSRTGSILWYRDPSGLQRPVIVRRDGRVEETPATPQPRLANPELRGSDELVVAAMQQEVGKLWLHSLTRAEPPRPLTVDLESYDRYPVVSPTGHLLLYAADRQARRYLVLTTLDRPNQEKIIDVDVVRGVFTPDGGSVVYSKRNPATGADLWIAPARGEGAPRLLLDEDTGLDNPQVSPDGRWLAYVGERFNRPQVLVRRLEDGEGPWQISSSEGEVPRWSADGKELFYVSDTMLMSAAVRTAGTFFEFDTPRPLFDSARLGLLRREYDPLPDGSGFVMVEPQRSSAVSDQEALILLQGWQPSR